MRVMVTVEARLIKTPDGNIYGKGPICYDFLRRYLKVFDKVIKLVLFFLTNHEVKALQKSDPPSFPLLILPEHLFL